MRRSTILLTSSLLAACAGEPPAPRAPAPAEADPAHVNAGEAPKAAEAPKTPDFKLTETAADKLGTAPAGFGLARGDRAPDATLTDIQGNAQSLARYYAQGPTLVVFYRGGWCPFCNLQLHDYTTAKADFEKRGVRIVAISVDRPTEEAKTQAQHGVPFPMLSDPKLVAHQAYHVVHVPGDAERKVLAGYKIDLAAYSGESHGNFAVPAIFLVDRDARVRFVHVDEDYKTRPSARQMLEVVDRTLGGR